jgi:hypothetical protein
MTPKTLSLLFLLAPLPAAAGALSELLMAPALFEAAPVGSAVVYDEDRGVPDVAGMTVEDVADGRVRLEVVAPGEMRLVRQEGGEAVPLGTFPSGAANPLLLYFLETTVRVMAEATGGSPYYIRNRIREALVASDLGSVQGEAREAVLAPFTHDANRDRMGAFGSLVIRLRFDPEAPSRILELSTDTAAGDGGYHERMLLVPEE